MSPSEARVRVRVSHRLSNDHATPLAEISSSLRLFQLMMVLGKYEFLYCSVFARMVLKHLELLRTEE